MKKLKILLIIVLLFAPLMWPLAINAQLQTDSNTLTTRVGNPTGSIQPPPVTGNLKQAIIDEFGITMNGFDQEHLLWTWERMWEVSNSNFTSLLRGSRVESTGYEGISSQIGCFGGEVSLRLGQYYPKEFFKFIILHEFGHIAQACNPLEKTRMIDQRNVYDQEGPISWYAGNTGVCFEPGYNNNYNEDYADMLAYYLDRTSPSWTSGPRKCVPPAEYNPVNPYIRNFRLHYNVAQSILGI